MRIWRAIDDDDDGDDCDGDCDYGGDFAAGVGDDHGGYDEGTKRMNSLIVSCRALLMMMMLRWTIMKRRRVALCYSLLQYCCLLGHDGEHDDGYGGVCFVVMIATRG